MMKRNLLRDYRIERATALLTAQYEDMCEDPTPVWKQVRDRFGLDLAGAIEAIRAASTHRNGGWY